MICFFFWFLSSERNGYRQENFTLPSWRLCYIYTLAWRYSIDRVQFLPTKQGSNPFLNFIIQFLTVILLVSTVTVPNPVGAHTLEMGNVGLYQLNISTAQSETRLIVNISSNQSVFLELAYCFQHMCLHIYCLIILTVYSRYFLIHNYDRLIKLCTLLLWRNCLIDSRNI